MKKERADEENVRYGQKCEIKKAGWERMSIVHIIIIAF